MYLLLEHQTCPLNSSLRRIHLQTVLSFLNQFLTMELWSLPKISCHLTSSTPSNSSAEPRTILPQVCISFLHPRISAYVCSAMIFLKDNVLLERDIKHDDIKPRLLGHWGTCPGIIMVYAHLNKIIRNTDLDALYVVGPGTLSSPQSLTSSAQRPLVHLL